MKPWRVHVLGDVMAIAPHSIAGMEVINMEVSKIFFDMRCFTHYSSYKLFGPILKEIYVVFLSNIVQKDNIESLIPSCTTKDGIS